MERLSEEFRVALRRALTGRTAARTALAYGLPKEAIRSVLNGHDPRLSRADDVCRALGITFLLGGPLDEVAGKEADRGAEARIEREIVQDVRLAELVSRLADQWGKLPVRDRAGVGLAIGSVLDLAGAKHGVLLDRMVEDLGWRILEEETDEDAHPEDGT